MTTPDGLRSISISSCLRARADQADRGEGGGAQRGGQAVEVGQQRGTRRGVLVLAAGQGAVGGDERAPRVLAHGDQRAFDHRGRAAQLEGVAVGSVGHADGPQADGLLGADGPEVGGNPAAVARGHRRSVVAGDGLQRARRGRRAHPRLANLPPRRRHCGGSARRAQSSNASWSTIGWPSSASSRQVRLAS